MLMVSQAQMQSLDAQWMQRLLVRVRQAVRQSARLEPAAPGEAPVPPVDDEAIDKCIGWAVDFGLSETQDLAAAAALLVAIRQHDRHGQLAWVKAWLDSPQASPPARLQLVQAQLADAAPGQPVAARVKRQVMAAQQAAEAA